jgi:murein DD-endopeptidase MepM/ murein hydrolase activator NlpD
MFSVTLLTGYIMLGAFRTFLLFIVFAALCSPALAVELKGKASQGGMIVGFIEDGGARVFLDDREIFVGEHGDFVLAFGREHPPEARLMINYKEGAIEEYALFIEQREYETQKIDGLDDKMVTPPAEALEQIRLDRAAVSEARANFTEMEYFLDGFIWPAKGVISGVYGSQRVLNGIPKQPHYGIDIAAPEGADVIAPAGGIVRLAHLDMYYTGKTLIIDHGYGVSSTLMHLSDIKVEEGQRVRQGDVVGAVGSSGRSTGAHLDWRMNWLDVRVDPSTVAMDNPDGSLN